MPTKRPRIMFICDEDMDSYLKRWSERESRTVSNLCEKLIGEAIAQDKKNQSKSK